MVNIWAFQGHSSKDISTKLLVSLWDSLFEVHHEISISFSRTSQINLRRHKCCSRFNSNVNVYPAESSQSFSTYKNPLSYGWVVMWKPYFSGAWYSVHFMVLFSAQDGSTKLPNSRRLVVLAGNPSLRLRGASAPLLLALSLLIQDIRQVQKYSDQRRLEIKVAMYH